MSVQEQHGDSAPVDVSTGDTVGKRLEGDVGDVTIDESPSTHSDRQDRSTSSNSPPAQQPEVEDVDSEVCLNKPKHTHAPTDINASAQIQPPAQHGSTRENPQTFKARYGARVLRRKVPGDSSSRNTRTQVKTPPPRQVIPPYPPANASESPMSHRNKKHNYLPSKEPHVGGDVAVGGSHGCDQENTIECHEASSTDSRSTASASPEYPEHHTRTRSYPDKPEKAGRSTTVSFLKFISRSNSRDTQDEDISYYKYKARRYKSKRKRLRKILEGAERELDKLKKENKELNAKFKVSHNNEISMADNLKVTQKVASAQERRANGLEVAIQNMQLYVGPQADDEVLKATFGGQLTGKVRTWSAAFVTNNQPAETYVQTLRNSAYAILSPIDQALELLREKRKRRLFVEGMVGSVLASNIFRTVTTEASIKPQNPVRPTVLEYSMDKCFAESISVMEQNLTNGFGSCITPLELNNWRAFTVSLASRLSDGAPHTNFLRPFIDELLVMLQPLAKPDVSTERLLQNLESIFRVAAELAFLLYRQRADWIVKYPFSKTCVFDGNTMEDIDDDEDGSHSGVEKEFPKQVEIFVFPGLYKRGNADGEGYDVESCMVKAKVRCVRFGS